VNVDAGRQHPAAGTALKGARQLSAHVTQVVSSPRPSVQFAAAESGTSAWREAPGRISSALNG
jgi:hypothetical protein